MSKKKAAGKLTQQKRPRPKYLGVKVSHGEKVGAGSILVKQRGTKFQAGNKVGIGRDHTLFAKDSGKVSFNQKKGKKYISVE